MQVTWVMEKRNNGAQQREKGNLCVRTLFYNPIHFSIDSPKNANISSIAKVYFGSFTQGSSSGYNQDQGAGTETNILCVAL